MDGHLITTAKYSSKEPFGASLFVVVPSLSLIAVLGLLVLMAVRAMRPCVHSNKPASLYHRWLHGLIEHLREKITSFTAMSLHISSFSWSLISFEARNFDRFHA